MKKKIKSGEEIKAWGITSNGEPTFNLMRNNVLQFEAITLTKKKAQGIAKEWAKAVDDDFKVVPVKIIFPPSKK